MVHGECHCALAFLFLNFGVKNGVWFLIKQKGVLIKWFLPGFRVVALVPVLLLGCDGLLGSGVSRGLIRPPPVPVVPAISSLPGWRILHSSPLGSLWVEGSFFNWSIETISEPSLVRGAAAFSRGA